MGEVEWQCAFKFSTARNPWTRWESWYSFCNTGYGPTLRLPGPQWSCAMARSMPLSSWVKEMIIILRGIDTLKPSMATQVT